MCCDGWSCTPDKDEEWGDCPACGGEVIVSKIDGHFYAAEGCNYSPYDCEECGSRSCDQSC